MARLGLWAMLATLALTAACGEEVTRQSADDDDGGLGGSGAGGDGSGGAAGCVDYGGVPAASCCSGDFDSAGNCSGTLVSCSFQAHIMPLFQRSCSLSASCHTGSMPKESLYLGPTFSVTPDAAELAMAHGAIVGVASNQSSLVRVAPGAPEASYLLAKTEYGDFSVCPTINCTGSASAAGCGERMPQASLSLPAHDKAMLAAWIADGAGNN